MPLSNVNTGSPRRNPRPPRRGPSVRSACEAFAAENRTCAEIVLQDLDRFGGPGSLMVRWAERVLAADQAERRSEAVLADEESGQGELFAAEKGGAICQQQL